MSKKRNKKSSFDEMFEDRNSGKYPAIKEGAEIAIELGLTDEEDIKILTCIYVQVYYLAMDNPGEDIILVEPRNGINSRARELAKLLVNTGHVTKYIERNRTPPIQTMVN